MSRVLAAVMTAPGIPLEIREFAEPELPDGSLLLRTLYSAVCGTDVHLWHGRLAGVPYPSARRDLVAERTGGMGADVAIEAAGSARGWGSEVAHFVRALDLLARHQAAIPWRDIGGRVFPLVAVTDALAAAAAMRIPKALVTPH